MKKHWVEAVAAAIGVMAVLFTMFLASCSSRSDGCQQYTNPGTCTFSGQCEWGSRYNEDGVEEPVCKPK